MDRNKRPMNSLNLPGTSTKNTRLKEEYDLAYYVHDRVELMHKVFSILSPKELKAMAPASCRKLSVSELQEICLEELLGMSSRRVCAVLDGVEPPSNSGSSESDSSDDNDDEVSSDKNRNNTIEVTETVCLDTESEDESVVLPSRSNRKRLRKKSKSNDVSTSVRESNKQKHATDRAGFTVLELLELQARARAIRAQLQAQGSKKDQSNTTQSSKERSENVDLHDDDDEEELIEVKEELPAVIEISSDEERVKIEDQKDEPAISNSESQEITKATVNVTKGVEKQASEIITKDTDNLNTNKDKDNPTNTNIENAKQKEKHKKSKNKAAKKKKSKDKKKSPIKLSPIKDSIYEDKNETEKQEDNDIENKETHAEDDDDVILINDDDDFTVVKTVQPDNTELSNTNVIVRKIQLNKENVVISVPNIANANCKIVSETTKRLNSTVSKVECVIEKKKLNSTVCKVSDKKSEKRKNIVKKKIVRRDSDDGINLELSDDEKLEMEYLCGDKHRVLTDGNSSGSDSDGISVVLNSNQIPITTKEKNALFVNENDASIVIKDKSSEKDDRNVNDKVINENDANIDTKDKSSEKDDINVNDEVVNENDANIDTKDKSSEKDDRNVNDKVINENDANIDIKDKSSEKDDRNVNDEVVTNNLIADLIENTIVSDTDNDTGDNLDRNIDKDLNKNDGDTNENDTNFDKTYIFTFNADTIGAISNKNINISEVGTINVTCIEDIPLMTEGPQLPSDLKKHQTDFSEETPNDNKKSDKTDTQSEDSEPDSETESGSSSDNSVKSGDENERASHENRKSIYEIEKSSPEVHDDIFMNKETCEVICYENDKELNDDDVRVDETTNEQNIRNEQENRELSEGEITDSSNDIEVMDLKPDVVCISGSDDDKPCAKKKKQIKRNKKNVSNKVLNKRMSIDEKSTKKNESKELITDLGSVKGAKDAKEITKITELVEQEEILELSDDSSCYEVEGVNILSKEPTAEEIEALSARIDDFERQDAVTNEEIRQHEARKDDNLTEQELESLSNVSWKDRYLDSKKVKVVMSTANILNALRKKNIELKKKIEAAKKETVKEVENVTTNEVGAQLEVEIGSIEHYNTLQGSTKYVDPVKTAEININDAEGVTDKNMVAKSDANIIANTILEPETNLTKEMKKDAKLLLKMYKRLLKYNDMNKVKTKDPKKKKKKKLKKCRLNDT